MTSKLYPVVLCGGAGSRLWPMSRQLLPKQFLPLVSERTMLQETVERLRGLAGAEPPTVVSNHEHRFLVAEQLRAINAAPRAQILEPIGRNTAPAVAVAALALERADPDAVMLVLPADHLIRDVETFHLAIRKAAAAARAGFLVTFGIRPDHAATGYGYIEGGEPIADHDSVFHVARFVEKPDAATARKFLERGTFAWNSGMFVFGARRYLEELGRHAPEMLAACRAAWEKAATDLDFVRLDEASFAACPADSIDYAVMEKTDAAAVVPVDIGWSDVGSWATLWEVGEKDASGNVLRGDVHLQAAENCYVRAESRMVSVLGLSDAVVVETDDAVLVASQGRSAEGQGHRRQARRRKAHRARVAPARVPSVGLLRVDRRRRPLPGEAPDGEARRRAQPADAPPPRRALGRGLRHCEGYARRRGDARRRERVDLHPDWHEAPARESGEGAAVPHRGAVGRVSRRGRYRAV